MEISLEHYNKMAERLTELEYRLAEQRWIPCSERLPEENQKVLLMMPHNMLVGFWEDVYCDGGRTWFSNSGDLCSTNMDVLIGYDDPIAWMPLPEPWKGDNNG